MRTSESITELAEALAQVQAELSNAIRDERNPHFGNEYVSLASATNTIRPEIKEGDLIRFITKALGVHFRSNQNVPKSELQRFFEKVAYGLSDCWYWIGSKVPSRSGFGYGSFVFRGSSMKAHRVSWILFNGEIPHSLKVLHRCDVPICVNPDHLFLGTQADNVADMIKKGRNRCIPLYGEDNPGSVLTGVKVHSIRQEYTSTKCSMKDLANKYGVTTMTICRAINGQTWRRSNAEN